MIMPAQDEKKAPTVAAKEPKPVVEIPKVEPKLEPKVEQKAVIQPIKYLITVIDAITKMAVDAKVRVQGLKDNVVVGAVNNSQGTYEFSLIATVPKEYRISVESDGYVFQNLTAKVEGATTKEKTIKRTIELRKLVVGVVSILRNIYFDFEKATFITSSYGELNKLETMMKQNQSLQVEIGGHTDSIGDKVFNQNLSQRRANAVKSFLTSKGIDTRRIKTVGYGESKPLASNDDESEGRQFNRRVEFKVLSN